MSAEYNKRLLLPDGSPRDRISGFETEYALNYRPVAGEFRGDKNTSEISMEAVQKLAPLTWRNAKTQFHPDGTRRYIDIGAHPELATAEDTDYAAAAHRLLMGHVATAHAFASGVVRWNQRSSHEPMKLEQLSLVANTLSPSGESWASHTSLLARRDLMPAEYTNALAAHRASRIVWSGAGVVNRGPRNEYLFGLSEKAGQIQDISNAATTRQRALVNLRDESLADSDTYQRVHDISGESIFSPLANALRLATDSIVLRACEVGVYFQDLVPINPVVAMKQISGDPSLKARVEMPYGQRFTGVELQMAIAERAIGKASSEGNITAQEEAFGMRWLALLADLRKDPELCARRVDWVVKRRLIERELDAKRGSGQSDLMVAWSKALDYHRLLPHEGAGMKLLRKGFFEDSPSETLLNEGLPLPETRAKVRGKIIQMLLERNRNYNANWDFVVRFEEGKDDKVLKLKDPYDVNEAKIGRFVG